MKKIVVVILILLFSTIVFSKQDENSYKIYYENFKVENNKTNTNVRIKYPQLKGMKSLEKQKKINQLIREKAIFTLYCFLQEKNAQSCKEKYTILQEKVHKKCVFFY